MVWRQQQKKQPNTFYFVLNRSFSRCICRVLFFCILRESKKIISIWNELGAISPYNNVIVHMLLEQKEREREKYSAQIHFKCPTGTQPGSVLETIGSKKINEYSTMSWEWIERINLAQITENNTKSDDNNNNSHGKMHTADRFQSKYCQRWKHMNE